jgi:putative oxidoreductase
MNKIVNTLWGNFYGGRAAFGLLVIRVIFGGALLQHGFVKIQHPFGWMGPEASVPGIFQALAAISEFGGGIALVFGFVTPIAALGIISTMAVAVVMAHGSAPWVSSDGPSKESALGYLAVALGVLLIGPGKFSLDALIFGRKSSGTQNKE